MVIATKEVVKIGTIPAMKPETLQVVKENLKHVGQLRLITTADCPEELREWNNLLLRVAARFDDACTSFVGIKQK